MADIPTPRSYQTILGDSLDVLLSKVGIKGIKTAGPIAGILETTAQSQTRTSQDIFQMLASRDVDNADGEALLRLGKDERLTMRAAVPASTTVTLGDSTFTKKATRIYQGKPAPAAGSQTLYVSDASAFTSTGSLYIGRGTGNVEGPLAYTSKVQDPSGAFWTITLGTNTSRFHNLSESVVLAQGGDRLVDSGTVVSTLQGNAAKAVKFATTTVATIPDGEDTLAGVRVVCQTPGIVGNVPAGGIVNFDSAPFVNATVTNPVKITNGRAAESKEEFRERIKAARRSKMKGTDLAITSNVFGATAQDEEATVISSSFVSTADAHTLYIDDGTGYEEQATGVAIESLIEEAAGGEQGAAILGGVPIAKAFAEAVTEAPYSLTDQSQFAVRVGGVISTTTFSAAGFRDITNASAYEVVAAINADQNSLFSARTTDSGRSFCIFAKANTNEDIQVTVPTTGAIDANKVFGFPLVRFDTLRLYRDDKLLYKDGLEAFVETTPQSQWDASGIVSGVTLDVTLDGTAKVTYTFVDADFVNAGTGYKTVSSGNSLASWASVINLKIPGLTAITESNRLKLRSNLGASTRAAITITPSAGMKSMFAATTVISLGRDNDYEFDRNTGEVFLTKALQTGSRLSAGTIYTRAYVESSDFSSYTVGAAGATLWWVADGAAQVVSHGLSNSSALAVSTSGGGAAALLVTLTAGGTQFTNVQPGDWVILWDPAFAAIVGPPAYDSLQGTFRVSAASAGTFSFEIPTGSTFKPSITPAVLGIVFVRTTGVIQKLLVPAGVVSPASISTMVAAQMKGVTASTVRTTRVRLTTDTFGSEGDIALVAADVEGAKLPFTIATVSNADSHLASVESGNQDHGTPDFNFGTVSSVSPGLIGLGTSDSGVLNEGQGLVWLNPLNGSKSNNLGSMTVISKYDSVAYTLSYPSAPNTPALANRVYGTSLFAFGPEDTLSLILDQDPVSKSFSTPLAFQVGFNNSVVGYYGATVQIQNPALGNTDLTGIFGGGFDFTDFKLYPQARAVANPPADGLSTQNSVLWRFKRFGPDGNKARISYTNPTAPSQGFAVSTAAGDLLDIFVSLPSGAARGITAGQRYAVESATYGGPSLRKVVYYAGVRASLTSDGAGLVTATITTGGGAPNPYITDHRFQANDIVYLSGGTTFPAGFATVQASGLTSTVFKLSYNVGGIAPLSAGPETLNVLSSTGVVPAAPSLSTVLVGDIVTLSPSNLDPSVLGTFRVADRDLANGLWFLVHRAPGSALSFRYSEIVTASNLQIFPIDTTQTNTAGTPNIATRVNALASNLWVQGAIPNYTKGGVGLVAGLPITISTFDAYLEDQTQPQNGFTFSGGRWYVKGSSVAAGVYALNINGVPYAGASWSSDEDWTNERAYLVPVTAPAIARYLNLASITGLASNAEVKTCARGNKLQIASLLPGSAGSVKMTGGTANAVVASVYDAALPTSTACYAKFKSADVLGLFAGQRVAVQGINKVPKRIDWDPTTALTISAAGPNWNVAISAGAGTVAKYAGSMTASVAAQQWQVERHGRFAAYVATSAPGVNFSGVQEGDWVDVESASGSSSNKGFWRVVRVLWDAGSGRYAFWVENPNAVEERAAFDTVTFWTADSILPGDSFSVNTDKLGTGNRGQWPVQSLGPAVAGVVSSFAVQATMAAAAGIVLSNDVRNVQVLPQVPSRLIKRILYVSPADSKYTYVAFDTSARLTEMSASAGTYISPLDKFAFGTDLALGLDGYRYNTGLIAECNKILYGDLRDKDTYPGVVAKGASINVSGPLVRRIQVSLGIRVRQGTTKDVLERVQSAVAGVINSAGVGESISIADIVAAAKKVRGVAGVAVLSPTYGPGSDQIAVQSFEKPMVLNLDTDVLVSLTGT